MKDNHEMTAREFVMVQRRLCNKYNIAYAECTGCPLAGKEVCGKFLLDGTLIEAVEQWAKAHPAKRHKTYAEDFCSKFPNTKIYEEEHRPWFCRKEIYEGKTGYCGGYSRGECCACWNAEMEGEK